MTDQMPEKIREKFIEKIPIKRIGTAEDVANAVSFLMKPDLCATDNLSNKFIT